jgi:hypothetical protein
LLNGATSAIAAIISIAAFVQAWRMRRDKQSTSAMSVTHDALIGTIKDLRSELVRQDKELQHCRKAVRRAEARIRELEQPTT